jgi:iron complex transport system substrate-binding protein
MRHGKFWSVVPPLLLSSVVATVAAGVDHFARPAGGLQLPSPASHVEELDPRTGTLVYPREVIDSTGTRVVIPHRPQRIVSQALSFDEFLYSLTDPRSVVAVSRYATDKRFSSIYKLTEQYHPVVATDPERVVSLFPDLILLASTARADLASQVRSSGAPVVRLPAHYRSLEEVVQTMRVIGYVLGADEAASREEDLFRREISAAAAMKPAGTPGPKVLALSGRFGFGRQTLIDDVITTLGAVNVASAAGVKGLAEVNSEAVARWNPDWIVVGCEPGGEAALHAQLQADAGISLTRAAREGHILVLESHIFEANSPYVTSLVRAIAEALYRSPQPQEGHRG